MSFDHMSRAQLLDELHARPAPRLEVPSRAIHLALKVPAAATRDRSADIAAVQSLSGKGNLSISLRHLQFARSGYQLRWENHTEFSGFSAFSSPVDAQRLPFTDADLVFPEDWEQQAQGRRIAAVMVEVLPMPAAGVNPREFVGQWLNPARTVMMEVLAGQAIFAADFTPDQRGWTRMVILAKPGVGRGRLGRTVQRLIDLETYRSMSMLGFVAAQELRQSLNFLDPQVSSLIGELRDQQRPASEALNDLLTCTAGLEALAIRHDFRFGATHAYAAIVADRLESLGGRRYDGEQNLGEFLHRRYMPSIRTVSSTEARLQRIIERVDRASDLLRTRVDVDNAQQSRDLLHSMDRRSEIQLRLQHTVEGLSVVAVTYYALGFLAYLLAPLAHALHVSKMWLMAGVAPVVLLVVWWALRRLRRGVHRL